MTDHGFHIGSMIRELNNLFERELNAFVAPLDLTASQALILTFLVQSEAPRRPKDIEAEFNISHVTVVGIAKRLEARGFVERQTRPEDKRESLVLPTAKAIQFAARMRASIDRVSDRAFAGLDEPEFAVMASCLERAIANMRQGSR